MPVNRTLKEKITQITNLPTLPQVAARLMTVINDPSASSGDVAIIVGQDISLCAKVLRLANSAFYGMPRTITSINNAVVILGLRVINTLVLSLTVFDMFSGEKGQALFDRRLFWKHSLACAAISRLLAQERENMVMLDSEECFCAGLLHDMGKVVMEQYLHDDMRRALEYAGLKTVSLYEAEKECLGYTHADVAQWLISKWQLPVELMAPIVYHHNPAAAPQCPDSVCVCHLADHLCCECGFSSAASSVPPPLIEECLSRLAVGADEGDRLREHLPAELEKMAVFLDIASEK